MNTWAPLFSKIVDSSLWSEPDHVCKIFVTMLAKKDCDHVVRASAYVIGNWARKNEAEVLEALKILSSPDKRRIEPQPFEGRRIKRVEDGWLILNGQYYEDLMRDISRKAYKRRKQAEYRDGKKQGSGPLPGEAAYVKAERNGDSEEELDRLSDPGQSGVGTV